MGFDGRCFWFRVDRGQGRSAFAFGAKKSLHEEQTCEFSRTRTPNPNLLTPLV